MTKRSIILDEITNILDVEWDLNHPDKSELILSKLEELGMLPPKTKLNTLNIEDNAWEPE
jgi:hypothetical protein